MSLCSEPHKEVGFPSPTIRLQTCEGGDVQRPKQQGKQRQARTKPTAVGLCSIHPGDEEAVPCRRAGPTVPPSHEDALCGRDGKIECSADAARGRSCPVFPPDMKADSRKTEGQPAGQGSCTDLSNVHSSTYLFVHLPNRREHCVWHRWLRGAAGRDPHHS
jgi:hypothetical protein